MNPEIIALQRLGRDLQRERKKVKTDWWPHAEFQSGADAGFGRALMVLRDHIKRLRKREGAK
jgi:hypothetical protein